MEEVMKRSLRILSLFVALAFVFALAPACKLPGSIDDAKNMKVGKFAQTIHLEKSELGKKIKTQWGSFKFSSSKQKAIKNLKKKKYKTFKVKTTKGKSVKIIVTYLGKGRYQLAMTGF